MNIWRVGAKRMGPGYYQRYPVPGQEAAGTDQTTGSLPWSPGAACAVWVPEQWHEYPGAVCGFTFGDLQMLSWHGLGAPAAARARPPVLKGLYQHQPCCVSVILLICIFLAGYITPWIRIIRREKKKKKISSLFLRYSVSFSQGAQEWIYLQVSLPPGTFGTIYEKVSRDFWKV